MAVQLADIIPNPLARHRFAVEIEHVIPHLDVVARQADHPLDEVGGIVAGKLEHHHIAALRIAAQETALHVLAQRPGAEGESVAAIAIGELLDKEIIADQ